jgi:hypothetical protein
MTSARKCRGPTAAERGLKAARSLIGEMVVALEGVTETDLSLREDSVRLPMNLFSLMAGLAREGRAYLARKPEGR